LPSLSPPLLRRAPRALRAGLCSSHRNVCGILVETTEGATADCAGGIALYMINDNAALLAYIIVRRDILLKIIMNKV
jgi:hypothetical protein